MKKFLHQKSIIAIYLLIFVSMVFLLVSSTQAATSQCTVLPGENHPPTQCNGHGLAGWGLVADGAADIRSVDVTPYDDNSDGKIDRLELRWQPRLATDGDTGLAAWDHWEVRYSEVNGNDGRTSVLTHQETSDPYLYPSGDNIIYNSLTSDPGNPQPSYAVGDPLLSGTGYHPRAFGEDHHATIEGATLERIRNKIVKFQVIEWYYQGALTENLQCIPANESVTIAPGSNLPPVLLSNAPGSNLPPGFPVNRTDANGSSLQCYPANGLLQEIPSWGGNPYCSSWGLSYAAGPLWYAQGTYNDSGCTSHAVGTCSYSTVPQTDKYYVYASAGVSYTYTLPTIACTPSSGYSVYWKHTVSIPYVRELCHYWWGQTICGVDIYDGYRTYPGHETYYESESRCDYSGEVEHGTNCVAHLESQSHTITAPGDANSTSAKNGYYISPDGSAYSIVPRTSALLNPNTPQQVLLAVTPPIAFAGLKPNFTLTFSNTNNLTGSQDITTTAVPLTTTSDASGTHNSATVSANVKTGEEYLVHSWETDIYGNVLSAEPAISEVAWTGTNDSADSKFISTNPDDLSNKAVLTIPKHFGVDTASYSYDLVKKYTDFLPNSADYEGEQVAMLTPPPVDSAPGTAGQATTSALGAIVNHDLLVHVNYDNKYPQLEVKTDSCDSSVITTNTSFSLKSENNTPASFTCKFKALNPASGTDSFKLGSVATTSPSPLQSWVSSFTYPASQEVTTSSPAEIKVSITPEQLAVPSGAGGTTDRMSFNVKAETIPAINDPAKIATDNGLTPNNEASSWLNGFNSEIAGQERAKVDCSGSECNRQGVIDLSKIISSPTPSPEPTPTCSLWADPNPIACNASTTLKWSTTNTTNAVISCGNLLNTGVAPVNDRGISFGPLTASVGCSMTVNGAKDTHNICGAPVNVGDCGGGPTPSPSPSGSSSFKAIFIAGNSVTINRDNLTINYDPRFLLNTPPGFGDLLAPLWKEK